MLHAIWPAIKGLSLVWKILLIVGIPVLLYGLKWGYDEYHQRQGRQQMIAKQEAELRLQAQEATQEAVRQAVILRQKVEEFSRDKEAFQAELARARGEIQRYAKLHQVRRIDNDAIAIVNEFARVLNDATADERVPDSGGTPTEPAVGTVPAPTTVDAFERLDELTDRLGVCEAKHRELSEWAIEKYRAEMEFYQRQTPE